MKNRTSIARLFVLLLAASLIALMDFPLMGQPAPGSRGGSRSGGSSRGGPGGGPGGGPMEFLRRLDANGNGSIEPSEQGRARPFLERFAGQMRLDLSRPIPLERISQGFQRMQQQGGSSRGSSNSRFTDMRGNRQTQSTELEPLIPGFGEAEDLLVIPGFGPRAEALDVELKEEDRAEAQQTMQRYDRNRDGILSPDEIRNGRWRDNPLQHDRNGDGSLTISELAARYSIRRSNESERRQQEEARRAASGGDSRQGSSRGGDRGGSRGGDRSSRFSRGGPPGGGGPPWARGGDSGGGDRMAMFSRSIMQRYDSNKSGVLEKDEWKNFRTDPSAADKNKDGKITSDELGGWMSQRFSQSRGGGESGGDRSSRSRGGDQAASSGGGDEGEGGSDFTRFKLPHERLPEGLPGWFTENDANTDGQIRMSEFSTSKWDEKTLAEYYQFDLNRDGVITPAECMTAVDQGIVRGGGGGSGSARSASRSRTSEGDESKGDEKSSSESGEIPERYIKYAVDKIREKDANKDGVLDKSEWSTSSSFKDEMDADKDGKLTPQEYARSLLKR